MSMKPLEIARRRMRNSRLTGAGFEAPDEVVGWHLAMQSQDYGPAKWSVGQRATGLTDDDADGALASGSIVRTHVLRPTWHFIARDDVRWLLGLSGPRVQQGNAGRYRDLGLDERTRAHAARVIVSALAGGNRLTRNEIAAVLDDAGIDRSGQRMPYILMHCELEAVICSGGLKGKQQTYALLDERVPPARPLDREDALVELTRRYLRSHGPATVRDLNWWSGLKVADIKRAIELLGSELRNETSEGLTFWSMASDVERPAPVRGVHFLQPYDEIVVGYTESRFFRDPRAEAAVAAWRDRNLPSGVVLRNGGVTGLWRRTVERDSIKIEAHVFEDAMGVGRRALEAAARDLGRFAGRHVKLETEPL
jgi:winged helix DNA-binding protein